MGGTEQQAVNDFEFCQAESPQQIAAIRKLFLSTQIF